jgi:hypothetical protein
LYISSNGDRWELAEEETGKAVVIHTPNTASGGKPSVLPLSAFLDVDNYGPEHEALMRILLG